jgi:hypothetical protein
MNNLVRLSLKKNIHTKWEKEVQKERTIIQCKIDTHKHKCINESHKR